MTFPILLSNELQNPTFKATTPTWKQYQYHEDPLTEQVDTKITNLAAIFIPDDPFEVSIDFDINQYARALFKLRIGNSMNDTLEEYYVQPVLCDEFYKDDPTWGTDENSKDLICPNITDFELSRVSWY